MKFYSDELNKLFDSTEELEKAEQAEKTRIYKEKVEKEKKVSERKEAAKKLKEAQEAMISAQHNYKELLEDFCEKYGSYHYSSNSIDDIPVLFSTFFNWL